MDDTLKLLLIFALIFVITLIIMHNRMNRMQRYLDALQYATLNILEMIIESSEKFSAYAKSAKDQEAPNSDKKDSSE